MSDNELLFAFAKTRSPALFNELDRRFRPLLFVVAYRMVGNSWDAEDAAQLAMLQIYYKAHQFHGTAKASSWAGVIAANKALGILRLRKRDEGLRTRLLNRLVNKPPPVQAEHEVTKMVALLPPIYRQVVELTDLDEVDYEDVAATLGIPVGTVRSRRHRALELLREIAIGACGPKGENGDGR